MTQLSLFNPIARNSDPVTSHLAAQEITEEGIRQTQAEIVLETIRQYPGHTSFELSRLCSLDRYQTERRCSDLKDPKNGALVKQCEKKICDISGRLAVTWRVKEYG